MIAKNVLLDLLAKDTLSLSLKELIKLQDVILEKEITTVSSRIEDSETEEERGPTIEATGLSVGTIRQTNEGTKRDIEEIVSHRTFRIPYTTSKPSSYHRISD